MATANSTVRAGRGWRRAALVLAGAIGVALVPGPAAAEEPTSSAEAAALLAARGHELEVITEEFNVARDELAAQQAAAQAAAAQAAAAQTAVQAAREQVSDIARTAYTGPSMGSLQAMLTSGSAEEFVDRVGLLETVADHQGVVLAQAVGALDSAAAAQAAADAAAAQAQQTFDAVAAQQADLEAQIADYRADFERLSAAEQRAAIEAASTHGGTVAGASRDEREEPAAGPAAAPSAPVVASSNAAQMAVDTAMAQRGKPYVWAAGGPSSFDCSGLTQFAYRAAGISLPHSSRMQSTMGQAVSRADLQPGDLVFFYSPVSHVGIYIGNGQMVHAPTSGDVVKVASIDVMGGYAGARRLAA
ncbi:C40 family peptidase [Blastococcus sp. SYSU D00820]